MTPPRWCDEQGRELPTRPCAECGRPTAVRRWAASTLRMSGWLPYEAVTIVSWCGHGIERIVVLAGDGTFGEVPVVGEAS